MQREGLLPVPKRPPVPGKRPTPHFREGDCHGRHERSFFKPGKLSAQDKASLTDSAAKQIINAEADQRARKTERLRQLREAQEAAVVAADPVPAKKRSGNR